MTSPAAIHRENDRLIVSGDLDFATVVGVWNDSLPLMANCNQLLFDFSQVKIIKSAGLALLIEWIKLAKVQNKKINFQHIPQQLMTIAKVCNIDGIFASTL